MQPSCLRFSRLGTAFLRRSVSSSRYGSNLTFSFPYPSLSTHRYSSENHQIAFKNGRTNNEVTRQQSSNRASDIPTFHSAVRGSSEPDHQKPEHDSENPRYIPTDVFPDLGIESRSGQETGWQTRRRMIRQPKAINRMREERNTAEMLSPVLEDRIADDAESLKVPRAQRKDSKRPGKNQRAKKAKAHIWKKLEIAEQQLELVTIRIEACRQLAVVKVLLRIIGSHLERVERTLEIWRQLILAEEQSEVIANELKTVERRLETRRQLNLVEEKSENIGKELKPIEGRIEYWRTFELPEKQSEISECELGTTNKRIEAWSQLVMLKRQLQIVEHQLHFVKWQLHVFGQSARESAFPRSSSERRARKPLSAPSHFLARWLNIPDSSDRERYWLENRGHYQQSPPFLLVAYLRLSTNPQIQLDNFDKSIIQISTTILLRRGFSAKDLAEWAWIVSAPDTKSSVERFVSTTSNKPIFLLLELLRRDSLDVRSLRLLLIYSWDQLLRIPRTNLATKSEVEIDSTIPWSTMSSLCDSLPAILTRESFFPLFRCLLRQARRIWPAAVVSISHMVEPFLRLYMGSGTGEPRMLDSQMHARLCKLYNQTLRLLALPSSINPLKSMVHNWEAQRVILEISTHFEPPLLLDHISYRAVARVLAASKKSERESRAATLRTRSWPPWRVEQDGMDARRPPEDDLSRVVVVANQAQESGYSEEVADRAIRVLGGQEPDGTPTIPTRSLFLVRRTSGRRRRAAAFYRGSSSSHKDPEEARVWTARIQSTRDIQEAWAAFIGYQEQGLQPSMGMYFAMFTKLQYEAKRSAGIFRPTSSPGDRREVLPPSNDNFSSFYQSRLQPPSIDELYEQMIHAGIRPSGRLLTFLVEHARNHFMGMRYLLDSRIDRQALALLGGQRTKIPVALKFIQEETFAAFISLLCRLAPRIVPTTTTSILRDQAENAEEDTEDRALGGNGWKLLELRKKDLNPQFHNPFLHCANLLNICKIRYRPAWYAFFRGLVRRGVVVHRSLIGDPRNDIVAWKILVAGLGDFQKCGLELDLHGFRLLCIGLEKALRASSQVSESEREDVLGTDQVRIVADEFMKLSEVNETSHPSIPKLLHPIEGAHLHEYVRVLGLSEDYDGLMYVLRWMVKNHTELDKIGLQSRNGPLLIQRTLIATKVFLGRTEYEAEAEGLVNSVENWDGWPDDMMAHVYLDRFSGWKESDKRESGDERNS